MNQIAKILSSPELMRKFTIKTICNITALMVGLILGAFLKGVFV